MLFIKNFAAIILGGFFSILLLSGCDEIEPPYMTGHEGNNGESDENIRRVLLEEFTGHTCPNCPEGSQLAKELKDFYGDQLVIMTIHAGYFAEPGNPPFDYNFITPDGEELHCNFNVSANPVGMINRALFDGNRLLSPSAWGEAITQFINQEPGFIINTSLQYETESRQLNVDTDIHSMINCGKQYYLSVFLIENNIIKPQRTNDPNYPSGVIEDYEHNYILRKSVNGTWGVELNDENITIGDIFTQSYSVTLDDEWVAENCAVIAFVYDKNSMEIKQVSETSIQVLP